MKASTARDAMLVVATLAVLAGCAGQPGSGPAVAPPEAKAPDRLAGRYLLHVEDAALSVQIRPNRFQCSARTFPRAAAEGFRAAVRQALAGVVADVEEVEAAGVDQIAARGARAIILVRAEQVEAVVRGQGGGMEFEVDIATAISVEGPNGRLLGSTVHGRGKATAPAGDNCRGGGAALRASTERATSDAGRRLAEALGLAAP